MGASEDIKRGSDALVYFHNEALKYEAYGNMSFDLLKQKLSDDSHGEFLSGFGFAINTAELNESEVRRSMESLADAGQGRLPARWMDFFNALKKDPSGFSFEAFVDVTANTARDVLTGVQKVGDTAVETLKNASGLVTYLPYLAFAGLAAYIYFRVKK